MTSDRTSSARGALGAVFGASLASAALTALAAVATLPAAGQTVLAAVGAAIGAVFACAIGTYALSSRAVTWGALSGVAAGFAWRPGSSVSLVAACWTSALVASIAVPREDLRRVRMATPPGVMAALHGIQLPLIVFSLAVSLRSAPPRPFVVLFSLSAFALWRIMGGECPLSQAEEHLRTLRGESARGMREAGFIGHHLHRCLGVRVRPGSVSRFSYATAALVFSWYVFQALR